MTFVWTTHRDAICGAVIDDLTVDWHFRYMSLNSREGTMSLLLSYLSLVLKEPCDLWIKAEGLWSDFSASFRTYVRSNPLVTHCDHLRIFAYTRAKLPFFLLLHPKCCLLWLAVLSLNPSALLPYSKYVTCPRKPNKTTLVFKLEDLNLALIPLVAQTKTCGGSHNQDASC